MGFTDRYQALGIPYPDAATMCHGHCEGTGWVPVCGARDTQRNAANPTETEQDPTLLALWRAEHEQAHRWWKRYVYLWNAVRRWDRVWLRMAFDFSPCDGWHFVTCPTCKGTGKRTNA